MKKNEKQIPMYIGTQQGMSNYEVSAYWPYCSLFVIGYSINNVGKMPTLRNYADWKPAVREFIPAFALRAAVEMFLLRSVRLGMSLSLPAELR